MANIKTRDAVKGTIKTIDKAAIATERMKSAYAKTKDKAEQGYYANESSATEYASDRISETTERVTSEGVHQFNKQGQKAVQTTRENIGKAKDKIADFKTKRAMKTAEQKKAQAAAEGNDSQIRHGTVSRSPAPDIPENGKSQLIKTRQQGQKTVKTNARSTGKTIKSTAKGTVKSAEKSVKMAQSTSKAAIKTTEQTAKAAQKTAQASVKAAQAAKATAKATAHAVKVAVKATIAAVKAIIAGTKALIAAIAAGGWIAVVVIAVCISTAAGAGTKSTNQDMADSTFFWGCARTYKLGVSVSATSWDEAAPKVKAKIERKVSAIADKVKGRAGRVKPGMKTRVFFSVMRLMQKNGWNEADVQYWKDKGWLGKNRPWAIR